MSLAVYVCHPSIIWADNTRPSSSYFKRSTHPTLPTVCSFQVFFFFTLHLENKMMGMTNPWNTYRIQHHLHAECSPLSVVKQIKSRNKLEKYKKNEENPEMFAQKTRIYTWPTNMAVVDFLQSALFWSFVQNVATDSRLSFSSITSFRFGSSHRVVVPHL